MKIQPKVASLLLLPLLATSSLAMPNVRRHKPLFRKIYGKRDNETETVEVTDNSTASATETVTASVTESSSVTSGASSNYTVSSTASFTDSYSSFASSSTYSSSIPAPSNSTDISSSIPVNNTSNSTNTASGLDTQQANPANLSSNAISSLLESTAAFATYTYSVYKPETVTQTEYHTQYSTEVVVSTSTSISGAQATSSGNDDMSEAESYWDQIQAMAESYAEHMTGSSLPTMTLEVVLEPTQVSLLFCFVNNADSNQFRTLMALGSTSSTLGQTVQRQLPLLGSLQQRLLLQHLHRTAPLAAPPMTVTPLLLSPPLPT